MSATEAEIAKKHGATKWSPEQRREFETLTKRSTPLGKRLKKEDFDREGNAVGEWAKVLAELDAWAAKYKVHLRTVEHESGGGAAGGPTPRSHNACPGTTSAHETVDLGNGHKMGITTTCHLRRQTLLGRCVYSCAGTIDGMTS